jgi:S1-C subfamily serine protease
MVTGGLLLEEISPEQRREAGVPEGMALHVKHAGEYDAHAAAKNAGVRKGDLLISYDGRTDLERETDLFAYSLSTHKPGDRVPLTVLRDGKKLEFTIPIQE